VQGTGLAGFVILLLAAVLLLLRRRAIRAVLVPPAYGWFGSLAATLFFLASLYLFVEPQTPFVIQQGAGARVSAVDIPVALLGSIIIAPGQSRDAAGRPIRCSVPSRNEVDP
jgi:hypothetical protein